MLQTFLEIMKYNVNCCSDARRNDLSKKATFPFFRGKKKNPARERTAISDVSQNIPLVCKTSHSHSLPSYPESLIKHVIVFEHNRTILQAWQIGYSLSMCAVYFPCVRYNIVESQFLAVYFDFATSLCFRLVSPIVPLH